MLPPRLYSSSCHGICTSSSSETLRQKYERDEASRKFTRLIEVEDLKNDFLSIAQHQLRTPLSGIRYALESLRGEPSIGTEAKELIDSGITRVGDSLAIINQMLMTAETGIKNLTPGERPRSTCRQWYVPCSMT